MTQPDAPRAMLAVVSSSPQGAMRPERAAREHRDVAGLEVVDQRDLQLVGIVARRDMIDIPIEAGARPAAQDQAVIERPDRRRHDLVAVALRIQDVRQHGGVKGPPDRRDQLLVDHWAPPRMRRRREYSRRRADP